MFSNLFSNKDTRTRTKLETSYLPTIEPLSSCGTSDPSLKRESGFEYPGFTCSHTNCSKPKKIKAQ